MLRRHWPAFAIASAIFALGLTVQAQTPVASTPAKPPAVAPDAASVKELIAREQALEKRYQAFTANLLALAQKLEKSDRVEDKDKAKALRKAIDLADKQGVDNKFTTLLRTLTKSANDIGLSDIASAKNQNDDLIKVLREILAIIQSDDELARIKEEEKWLQELLARLNGIIRGEKILDARANSNKGDPKQLARDSGKLRGQTSSLADKMGAPKAAGPKSSEAKGAAKPGKPEDMDQGENKEDTKDPKADERANADKNDPMKGDGADSKPSKGGPPSEAKPSKGSPMEGAGSASKPMAGSPMKPPMDKQTAQKPAETRNKQDNKGDQKGSASKSPPSDQQASSKGQGSPSDGTPSGSPKPGSSGSPPSGSPPPSGPKAPGAENVRKAIPDEDNATGNLDKDKRPQASDDIQEAVKKLEKTRDDIEKRLKQLREQELERILANLEARVNKMLQMQIEVKGQTETIYAVVQKHPEKKALPVDFQNSQKQEDREAEIIQEADKAIQLLVSEGSAVAFPAVFEEVRKDMARVKERLHDANVGEDTQSIEADIIEALTHMRDALKKAQQELGKSPPPPPGSPSDQPQLQKLLDQIAELKMIRELQKQVNARTKRYGAKTPDAEQSDDKQIKKELKDLSDRQERIETMINNLVTKKNQ